MIILCVFFPATLGFNANIVLEKVKLEKVI